MITIEDYKKLNAKDRIVVNYLARDFASKGLDVSLRGSAANGNRDYNDVDLLVEVPDCLTLYEVTQGLRGRTRLAERLEGLGSKVEEVGGEQAYINTNIDERLKITTPGRASVDLCLRVSRRSVSELIEARDWQAGKGKIVNNNYIIKQIYNEELFNDFKKKIYNNYFEEKPISRIDDNRKNELRNYNREIGIKDDNRGNEIKNDNRKNEIREPIFNVDDDREEVPTGKLPSFDSENLEEWNRLFQKPKK